MLGDQEGKLEQAIIVARNIHHLHSGGGTARNEAHKQEHGRQGKEALSSLADCYKDPTSRKKEDSCPQALAE